MSSRDFAPETQPVPPDADAHGRRTLERTLQHALDPLEDVKVTRLPRGFLVEANEEPGPLLEAVHRAALDLERGVEAAYPVFHHEMGPVWTGTLQAVFDPPAAPA